MVDHEKGTWNDVGNPNPVVVGGEIVNVYVGTENGANIKGLVMGAELLARGVLGLASKSSHPS